MKVVQERVVSGLSMRVEGRWLRTARLKDEWFVDIGDPSAAVESLRHLSPKADILSFLQRPTDARGPFPYERTSMAQAFLPITTFDQWYRNQINNKTRNLVTKARKKGVDVRTVPFDDHFVRGMMRIFNEWPVRQGRLFWHYQKSFETLKREFSRYMFRETIAGAFVNDELVGFIFLADAGRIGVLTQIISMMQHRDKAVNNALMAKAVELCADKGMSHLMYGVWPKGSLADFKRHNGFEPVDVPRYYVPLTTKGALALRLGLHRGLRDNVPERVTTLFRDLRFQFYTWRYGNPPTTPTAPEMLSSEGR